MIMIGDKLQIKKSKQRILTNLYQKNDHNVYQDCGVDPYHANKIFVLVKTYGDYYIVRVYNGKQHYTIRKDVFKKVT